MRIDRQGIDELLATLDRMSSLPSADRIELRESLPDAVVHASTIPSPLARRLIRTGNYSLVPLPFADAFSRITVEEDELDRDHLDQVHVVPARIPAYMYGVTPPLPEVDCPTIGCPLILIVHSEVPEDVVWRVLPRLFSGPVQRVYRPPPLDQVIPTYPWHPASIAYRDRDKPLVRADVAEAISTSSASSPRCSAAAWRCTAITAGSRRCGSSSTSRSSSTWISRPRD